MGYNNVSITQGMINWLQYLVGPLIFCLCYLNFAELLFKHTIELL